MLTEKPWRLEAIVRLLAGMVTCVFMGSLALTVLRYDPAAAKASPLVFYGLSGAALATFLATLWLVLRPWKLEQFKVQAGMLLVCAYAGLALSGAAQHQAGPGETHKTVVGLLVGALGFQGAGILLIWLFVRQHGLGLREAFGLAFEKRRALLLGATAALAFMPVALGLQFGIATLAGLLNWQLPTQDAVLILRLADSWTDRIALGIVAVVLAPLAEEGLFRGIFYPVIKGLGHPRAALWITSIGFALIHFNALSFVPLLVLAAVLVTLYERTGNLLSCIACHATFNFFNFIMLFVLNDSTSALPGRQ